MGLAWVDSRYVFCISEVYIIIDVPVGLWLECGRAVPPGIPWVKLLWATGTPLSREPSSNCLDVTKGGPRYASQGTGTAYKLPQETLEGSETGLPCKASPGGVVESWCQGRKWGGGVRCVAHVGKRKTTSGSKAEIDTQVV